MKRGLQAFGFLVLIIAFNGALYGLIDYLPRLGIISGGSFFLALVLFLSFALSIAILLIVALGERVNAKNIKNEWIKKIGVTPILIIVAVLISVAFSFSPLADKILPSQEGSRPQFMLADLGITCVTRDENKSPQATSLLTVITSAEAGYITSVNEFLKNQEFIKLARTKDFHPVAQRTPDELRDLLWQYVRSGAIGAETLGADLSDDAKWTAYKVDVRDPRVATFMPVPTLIQKNHKTRLFVVTTVSGAASDLLIGTPPLTAGLPKRLLPLFSVDIFSNRSTDLQTMNLDFRVFADHACWQIGR